MTGLDLHHLLEDAAWRRGVSLRKFVAPLSSHTDTFLSQLKQAKKPKPRTIERVNALIEGRPIPPCQGSPAGVVTCPRAEREARGLPPSKRMIRDEKSLSLASAQNQWIEHMRQLTELAHETRRPGQSVADRVRELRREKRDQAREIAA